MEDYIDRLLETLEDARERFEEATIEGTMGGDTTNLMEILSDLTDELSAHSSDEEE